MADEREDQRRGRTARARRSGRTSDNAPATRGTRTSATRRATARRRMRPSKRADTGAYKRAAEGRLKSFRQGSVLAVGFTGLALLLAGDPAAPEAPGERSPTADTTVVLAAAPAIAAPAQEAAPPQPLADTVAAAADTAERLAGTTSLQDSAGAEATRSVQEATGTVRELVRASWRVFPKVVIALIVLLAAGLFSWLLRRVLRAVLGHFERADAASALAAVGIWILAIAAALSILAGDPRALIGSVGLVGLALSWALQGPIESFTAWLLNSFKGYYRPGDRIAVGDVFGDVYRIDILNTTIWEAGGPDKPVQAAQPTGALITFPNSELLRSTVVNYTRDFPYVWDEVVVGVANESDLPYAQQVAADIATAVVGPVMREPAGRYRDLLARAGLSHDVAEQPQVFMAPTDSWMNLIVRYLVPARERRRWSSELHRALATGMSAPEHAGRITGSYPRTVVQRLDGPASGGGGTAEAAGST